MGLLRQTLVFAAVFSVGSTMVGCGNSNLNFVKNVQLKTYQQNNDSFGEVKADLDTGGIQLPSFSLPIFDPRNPAVTYGSVSVSYALGGLTELAIDVDLTEVAQVSGGSATLPNGAPLPVGGLGGAGVIELPVGNTSAKVYIAFGGGVALVGTAIPIQEFNGIGGYVGGASLFIPFNINNQVTGTAGIFTGRQAGQNGIAFFADAGGLLKQVLPKGSSKIGVSALALSSSSIRSIEHPVLRAAATGPSQLSFPDIKPSKSKRNRINREVYKLHSQGAHVHLN